VNQVFLSLGSNLGDRLGNLQAAFRLISEQVGEIVAASSVYETEPWGHDSGLNFYNQVISLATSCNPLTLLRQLKDIEKQCGRNHNLQRYAPRELDLDILFYNREIVDAPKLKIPHPALKLRNFVLVPLAEIAPGFIHPETGESVMQMLATCRDDKRILKKLSP
jgi:2-amino-4-hydroxy-6-hydroxymethyldihydropteridine diphosphokinase